MQHAVTGQLFSDTGTLTVAEQIEFDENRNVKEEIDNNISRISTLENTAFNSGRSFVRFNDGFTIDETNLATFEDKNIIYTAKNDKALDSTSRADVNLPTDAQIATSGEAYPIVFEFTHLGGTAVFNDRNLLRLFVDGVEVVRLVRDQVSIAVKTGAGVDWAFTSAIHDPNDTILPTGVFNLKTDTPIDDISTISTELSAVTIVAGDAYLVTQGGAWSGFTVTDNSVIVALVNSASLVDSNNNNDWLLLENPRVNAESAAFLANWARDGIRYNGNRNVQVDPANVLEFNSIASGTPIERNIGTNRQGQNRSITYANVPLQLSDIVGGRLQLGIQFALTSTSGFAPAWVSMRIEYPGGIIFDFPLQGAPLNGNFASEIDISNVDYSSALNQDATVTLFYNFSGISFLGTYTITNLANMSKGRLNDAVRQVANIEVMQSEARTQSQIDALRGDVNEEDSSLQSILNRISPYGSITVTNPDIYARFSNSTGSDNFPSTLDDLTQVSTINPRFTGGTTALFVAVRPEGSKVLNNISTGNSIALDDSEANVDLGESLSGLDGSVYFVYRVTGLTVGHIYEVDTVSAEQVIAWQNDIENLEADVKRIDTELEHALLNLDDEVVQVLENELTVTEENTPNIIGSDYNNSLTSNNQQAIFYETNLNTFGSGVLNSSPINENIANDRYRNKLLYIPKETVYSNQTYLTAFDGANSTDLISYVNGVFFAKVFVDAIPAGTSVNTIYPSIQNRVSGASIWNTIPALTFVNGAPVPEADEVFFVNNVPSVDIDLTIQYRGHSNGNIFGTNSIVLPANQDIITFVLDDGDEQATVEVLRRNGQIRVSITERVNIGLPTINDVEVILSFQETRSIPSVPASVRDVEIERVQSTTDQVFATKADSNGNLILVGTEREINTNYLFTDLFSANESGYLSVAADASFLDYESTDIIASIIIDLENHSTLPQFGLFTTLYDHETLLNFGVQVTALDDAGNVVSLGSELILASPNGTKYKLQVSNQGNLSTTTTLT